MKNNNVKIHINIQNSRNESFFTFLMPLKPTWKRYKDIFLRKDSLSIYRKLEYELISKIKYEGKILDYGGGDRAHYVDIIHNQSKNTNYASVNISREIEPTYLIEKSQKLPLISDNYDMIISFNTLEHIYDDKETLSEMIRVLKPGGQILLTVPFLYRVHGSPEDYNRHTMIWWAKTLSRFDIENIQIRPIVWDYLTTGLSVVEGAGPLKNTRKILIPFYGLLYSWYKCKSEDVCYPVKVGEQLSNMALGYVISGNKIK